MSESMTIDLFRVDVLPAHCSIEGETVLDPKTLKVLGVRFRAARPVRRHWWQRERRETSEWSGWFEYEDEPIFLHWDTFWEAGT